MFVIRGVVYMLKVSRTCRRGCVRCFCSEAAVSVFGFGLFSLGVVVRFRGMGCIVVMLMILFVRWLVLARTWFGVVVSSSSSSLAVVSSPTLRASCFGEMWCGGRGRKNNYRRWCRGRSIRMGAAVLRLHRHRYCRRGRCYTVAVARPVARPGDATTATQQQQQQ